MNTLAVLFALYYLSNMNNDFIIDESTALILEGGGMRGTFTSGVLDNFLDKGIDFPFTV